MKTNTNAIKRIAIIQQMVDDLYEPGNQRKSKIQIFRQHICKIYPMSERTFWRMMSIDLAQEKNKAHKN